MEGDGGDWGLQEFEKLEVNMNRELPVRGGGGEGRSKVRSMGKSQFGSQEAQVFQEETEEGGKRVRSLGSMRGGVGELCRVESPCQAGLPS